MEGSAPLEFARQQFHPFAGGDQLFGAPVESRREIADQHHRFKAERLLSEDRLLEPQQGLSGLLAGLEIAERAVGAHRRNTGFLQQRIEFPALVGVVPPEVDVHAEHIRFLRPHRRGFPENPGNPGRPARRIRDFRREQCDLIVQPLTGALKRIGLAPASGGDCELALLPRENPAVDVGQGRVDGVFGGAFAAGVVGDQVRQDREVARIPFEDELRIAENRLDAPAVDDHAVADHAGIFRHRRGGGG